MRIVQINSFGHLSTGSVMRRNHARYVEEGHESWMMWGRTPDVVDPVCEFRFTSKAGIYADVIKTRLFGRPGFHSRRATRRLLAKLDEIDPDVVHLHNLHGYFVNVEMLFEWLAAHDCKVLWTLHDCWAFTGHCAHFTYVKCAQWKDHCAYKTPCPQLHTYPKTCSKASCAKSFEDKKRLFCLLPPERMTLIAPSQWLADLVGQSFLAKYPVEVRHNTIDTNVFKPTPSDFRERYGIGDRFMILGVASTWTERKGLGDFVKLARELDSEKYAIVLVGLSDEQIKRLPEGIVGIKRTDSCEELAGIYSTADVLFNPTVEDNYPTVNLEAEACGTSVVTYDTGGCLETIDNILSIAVEGYSDATKELQKRGGDGSESTLVRRKSAEEKAAAP